MNASGKTTSVAPFPAAFATSRSSLSIEALRSRTTGSACTQAAVRVFMSAPAVAGPFSEESASLGSEPAVGGFGDGASRARTGDLRAASATLSQLSYGPVVPAQCSAELEILGPVNAQPLVVARGR